MIHRIDLCRGWELWWTQGSPEPARVPGARVNLPVTIGTILRALTAASTGPDAPVENPERLAPALNSFKLVRRFGRPPKDAPASRMELWLATGDMVMEAWLCTGATKHYPKRNVSEGVFTWDVTGTLAPRNALWVACAGPERPVADKIREAVVLHRCELRIDA